MQDRIRLLSGELGKDRVKCNIDISEYMQNRLGGRVAAFYIATTAPELIKAVEASRELKINFLVIGSGSKIAISSTGMAGFIIKNRSDSLKIFGVKGKVSRSGIGIEEAFLEADSGISTAGLTSYIRQQGLLEPDVLNSMSGSLGGCFYVYPAIREISDQVKVLTRGGALKTKQANQIAKDDIIISVVFKLRARN